MSMTLNTLMENPAAAAFGAAGLSCQLLWPLFSRRDAMLSMQLGIGSNYAMQYALLGAWSGAAVCALGATQTLIALLAGDRPWLRYTSLAFLPIVALACLATWSGPQTILIMSGCMLVMIGRLQQNTLRLRQFMLFATPLGMAHDLMVGAAPALAGACISMAVGLFGLIRDLSRHSGRNHQAFRISFFGKGASPRTSLA